MNLKAVVSIAKRYQGLGLSLQELISAGNLGLVIAYDKFDPNRSKLKNNIIEQIKPLPDKFTFNELNAVIKEYFFLGSTGYFSLSKLPTGIVTMLGSTPQ